MALTDNFLARGGRAEPGHIPPLPLWVVIIRISQLILAIVVLGLAAEAFNVYQPYENTVYNADLSAYGFGGFSLTGCRMAFFVFAWTILYLIYLGVTLAFLQDLYNVWIQIVLESLTCLWWLITFALLANDASNLSNLEGLSESYGGETISVSDYLPAKYTTALSCEKAAAGLGALEWLLFVITLVMFGIALHKHRAASATGTATNGAGVTEEVKMNTVTSTQAVPAQDPRYPQQYPQQQYPQQQYPQQQYQQQQMA